MKIIEPSKAEFNEFVLQNNGNFQQSWDWGQLQEAVGRKVKRLLLMEDQKPQVAACFIRHDLPFGKYYWICPRGPVIASPHQAGEEILKILGSLRSKAPRNDSNAVFIRIEPEVKPKNLQPTTYNLKKASHDHSPRATILVDLEKSEDELLSEMHSKTRYNIGLAERKGVQFITHNSKLITQNFLELLERTAKRDKFSLHPRKYYEEMLELPFIKLFTAEHGSGLAAGAIVSFFGNRATYLHGASDYRHRKLMAPHLLHWEIMKQAKQAEIRYYDLGGVAPREAEDKHPWAGITRFKRGFGGEYTEYIGTLDYVQSPLWYTIYKIGRAILST